MSFALLLLLAPAAPAVECLTPFLLPPPGRPTEGSGLYAFDPSDVVETFDTPSGDVRVHYSVSGPNVARLDDEDFDGFPDFAETVGIRTEQAFQAFQAFGFRRPLSEADLDLGDLGGSPAFDVYLVDFAGVGDGMFAADACTREPNHCAGYFVMENDFEGYGYPDLDSAIVTLTSHELFHAVQQAYESESPIWFTEGTAVWAERLFDAENEDFLHYADAYLDDTGRSLDQPPPGPVPTFAYATCLWWRYLTIRYGIGINVAIQEGVEWDGAPKDTLAVLEATLQASGGMLAQEWATFASWNLATRGRSGTAESYDFASQIGPVEITEQGWPIEDDNRFYPLAASYFRIDHPGGDLWFAQEDDATGVSFALHPVAGGAPDGPVEDALVTWIGSLGPTRRLLASDLPAGGYVLVGAYGVIAESSRKVHLCLGDEDSVLACLPGLDTAEPDTGDTSGDTAEDGEDGCGCSSRAGRRSGGAIALLALVLATLRRRR